MEDIKDRNKDLEAALKDALRFVKKFPAITKTEHKAKEYVIKKAEKALNREG